MKKLWLFMSALLVFSVCGKELVSGNFSKWQKNSPGCTVVPGGVAISSQKTDRDLRWYFLPAEDFSSGGVLTVKTDVVKENIVSGRPDYRWSSAVLVVVGIDKNGKRKAFFSHTFGRDSGEIKEFSKRIKLPAGFPKLEISFNLRSCSGKVIFRNISINWTPATPGGSGSSVGSGEKELVDGNFKNWKRNPKYCTVEKSDSIAISSPDTSKDLSWALIPQEDFSKGGIVRISSNVVKENIVSGRPDYRWSAAVLTVVAVDDNGKRKTLAVNSFGRESSPGQKFTKVITVPVNTKSLLIAFNLRYCSGKVSFRDLSIKVMDIKKKDRIFLKSYLHPHGVYLTRMDRFPRKVRPLPVLPGKDAFALFRIDVPRQTFDVEVPESKQLTDRFSAFSVPGIVSNLFIGCYAAKAVKGMTVTVQDLTDDKGNRIPGSGITVRRAHNWAQCGDRGQRLNYYVVPELLLAPEKDPDLPAGSSAMYLLRIDTPANCVPGIYRGKAVFSVPGGESKTAAVSLKVFPVKLEHPDPEKFVTIAHIGAYGDREDKMIELCRELKYRGFEGMLIACHYGKGRLALEMKNGKLAIRTFDRLDHAVAGYCASGMTGPFVIHLSDQLEVAVARATGVPAAKIPRGLESSVFIPGMETEEFKNAQIEALNLIRERCKGIKNIVVMGLDEPYGARIPRAKWEMELIRKAGFRVGFYGDEKTWFPLQPDFMISASRFHSEEFKSVKADCRKKNARFLQYGGSGSYGYAYGGLMPSRATHGWGAYLNGVSGYTAWTFFALKVLDRERYNYLDTWATVIHVDEDYKLLYTLQYEGIAEGIADYAFLNTLENSLKRNSAKPAAAKIRGYFEALKKQMRQRLSDRLTAEPSVSPEDVPPELLNYEADELRLLLISWIMELEK